MPDDSFLDALMGGRVPAPESAKTLGLKIVGFDPEARSVELEFEGRPEFANPIGNVQGGFLSAMLDDTMGLATTTVMDRGDFAPTLTISVQFHRPAAIGKLQATGRVVGRGREVFQCSAELTQGGKLIASAVATALLRKMPRS